VQDDQEGWPEGKQPQPMEVEIQATEFNTRGRQLFWLYNWRLEKDNLIRNKNAKQMQRRNCPRGQVIKSKL
jgi:hypothetical protein